MERFSKYIVNHKIQVIVLFILLLIPSAIGALKTKSNYDILSYMPGDLNSREGEKILEEIFDLSGTGLIVINSKELWEMQKLKKEIESLSGVDSVISFDDFTDIVVPVDFMNSHIRDRFIKGESVLLQVNFKENSRAKGTIDAVKEIRDIIGDKELFGGEPVILDDLQTITSKEMKYYMIIAGISIYIILSLSMTSFLEPLLFLAALGVAIAINMGTNIIKGEISFITASIAAVMQLGISMDYSIFLLHRFEEEKLKFSSIEEAMISAMTKTSVAVASSALTTIAGFAALMVMKNGIGGDLGFVIGKGVVLSLIVNLTLLPCLILIFNKYADMYRHKPLLPTFRKLSKWIVKWRWAFFIIIILISIPSYFAQRNLEYYYATEHYLPKTTSSAVDTEKISDKFGATEVLYVITKDNGRIKERELIEEVKKIQVVDSVIGMSEQVDMAIPDTFIPKEVSDNFKGGDYGYFQVFMTTPTDDRRTFDAIDKIRQLAAGTYDEYYVTGRAPLAKDLADLVDTDTRNVAIVSISAIVLILALSFMSVSIPLILILVIQLAIWINTSIPYFQGIQVASITPVIIGAIQLGATVDYAILFTSRYRENLESYKRKIDAIRQTIEDTGRSILTSALTMLSATV
ncbi:MAG TPA: MMPL family transporter, partial [Clostridiales bacterium]|nr:MMPL family transporter [Clostridiales bacterium]